MTAAEPGRVLLLQLRRIGDLALTFPLILALEHAGRGVSVMVPRGLERLLAAVCPQAEALVWEKSALRVPLRQLRSRKWSAALDLTRTDRGALFLRLSGAARRIAYTEYAGGWHRLACTEHHDLPVSRMHTLDYHLGLAQRAGLISAAPPPAPQRPDISPATRQLLGGAESWIILHPGTTKAEKYWPAEHWRSLIRSLQGRPERLVITGGRDPSEQAAIRELLQGNDLLDLSGRLPLEETCALAAQARAVISVDTGIMHLAALWHVPQVALFGPTNPLQWMPRHPRAAVLSSGKFRPKGDLKLKKKQRLAALGSDSEWEPLASLLPRLDQTQSHIFHVGFAPGTMAELSPESVLTALDRVLAAG